MSDPYSVLGLPPESGDESIRRRYLELIRRHSPDRDPEQFALVHAAYEKLRDPMIRLAYRLFKADEEDSIDALLSDARSTAKMRRPTVEELLSLGRKLA